MGPVLKAAKWLGVGLLLTLFAVLSAPDADVPSPGHFVFLFLLLGVWLAWIPFTLRRWGWRRAFLAAAVIVLLAPTLVFSYLLFDMESGISPPPPGTPEEAIALVSRHKLEGGVTVAEAAERVTPEGEEVRWEVQPLDPDEDTVYRWWVKVGSQQFRVTFLGGVREGFYGG
jgi:hypothetical protein